MLQVMGREGRLSGMITGERMNPQWGVWYVILATALVLLSCQAKQARKKAEEEVKLLMNRLHHLKVRPGVLLVSGDWR